MLSGNPSPELLAFLQVDAVGRVAHVTDLAALKALDPVAHPRAFLVCRTVIGDGLGGLYDFDLTASGAEDTVYMNTIPSSTTGTGRWVRVFQKAKAYPQGVMVTNGGVKTFYVSATTDSNGDATFQLTDDGTSTGNALFTELWMYSAQANSPAVNLAAGVNSFFKSVSANLKTMVFGQYKENVVTITLGLLLAPLATVGAGTSVLCKVEGI